MSVLTQFILPISPVLAMVCAALLITLLEGFSGVSSKTKLAVGLLGCAGSLGLTLWLWQKGVTTSPLPSEAAPAWLAEFFQSYRLDNLTHALYLAIALFTGLGLVFLSFSLRRSADAGESYLLVLFVASGIQLLVSADSLIVLFLALELLSLPTYVLVGAVHRNEAGCEGALKYFLFGSLASVLLLLGIAFLYANFGTLHLHTLAERIRAYGDYPASPQGLQIFAVGGLALMTIAAGFKVGLVPFHMWVPDAYQGAATPVTAYMGAAIKLAGFGLVMRLLWGPFLPLAPHWIQIIDVLALLSMFLGNLAAIAQDDLKRLFAYSSIAHAGYLMLGIASLPGGVPNFDAIFYYLLVYGLMFMGLFGVLLVLEREGKPPKLEDLTGLAYAHPWLALCLGLFALTAAGIPPTSGFLAKYFIFLEAVRAGKTTLVVGAVISSLIGVYYYLRLIVYAYMREPVGKAHVPVEHALVAIGILACAAGVIFFTVVPGALSFGRL